MLEIYIIFVIVIVIVIVLGHVTTITLHGTIQFVILRILGLLSNKDVETEQDFDVDDDDDDDDGGDDYDDDDDDH